MLRGRLFVSEYNCALSARYSCPIRGVGGIGRCATNLRTVLKQIRQRREATTSVLRADQNKFPLVWIGTWSKCANENEEPYNVGFRGAFFSFASFVGSESSLLDDELAFQWLCRSSL